MTLIWEWRLANTGVIICTMMKKATQRIAWGVVRGTVAALAMTGGLRQATTGLGFVEQQRAVREEGAS